MGRTRNYNFGINMGVILLLLINPTEGCLQGVFEFGDSLFLSYCALRLPEIKEKCFLNWRY